jgi:diguanylate cyclase (GGDEF)-like protein/PAS domain S-box-containing protein
MLEAIGDLIVRYDCNSRRIYVSPSAREMLGYEPKEMLAMQSAALIHPEDIQQAEAGFLRLGPAQPRVKVTMRVRRRDGCYIWCENRYCHLPGDDGVMVIARDITLIKQAEDGLARANGKLAAANIILKEQAQHDPLTSLANRRLLDERLDDEFANARIAEAYLGLIMFDVDCFKAYNDFYGHLAGDDVLRRVARTVCSMLRRANDLAARYGGEEIVVLLPGSDAPGTLSMADRIREAVADLNIEHAGNPHGYVTISAGACAVTPVMGIHSPVNLVRAADRALYASKAAGRNRVSSGIVEANSQEERKHFEGGRPLPQPLVESLK